MPIETRTDAQTDSLLSKDMGSIWVSFFGLLLIALLRVPPLFFFFPHYENDVKD